MNFEVQKGTKENLFVLFLNATNREYTIKYKGKLTIFTVKKPYFSQDEVALNLFYKVLLEMN